MLTSTAARQWDADQGEAYDAAEWFSGDPEVEFDTEDFEAELKVQS